MASVFESISRAVHMKRLYWPEERRGSHVLWPVWMRRVSAPKASDEDLGPFERAILGCARAMITDASHISELLHIDPKLVRFIQSALKDNHLIDTVMALTERGRHALEHGEAIWRNVETVHVFQCAMTGAVLHRVTNAALHCAAVEERDGVVMLENTYGKDTRTLPCIRVVPTDDLHPPPPRAEEVLHAIRLHRHERRFPYYSSTDITTEHLGDTPLATALTQVRVIDECADPMFLVTVAYGDVESLDRQDRSLRILDPFGIGESRQLAAAIRDLLKTRTPAAQHLSRLRLPIESTPSSAGVADPPAMWTRASEQVKEQLRDDVHPAADYSEWTGLDHLISMQEALEWLADSTMGRSQRDQYLRKAATSGRAGLESCLRSLANVYSLRGAAAFCRSLGNSSFDRSFVARKLDDAARTCGLSEVAPGSWIPPRFRVKPEDLRSVVEHGNFYKLGAAVAATLLAAAGDDRHPLRDAAVEWVHLLSDLDDALGVAGEAAHDGRGTKVTDEGVMNLSQLLYRMVREMLGGIAQQAIDNTR